MNKKTRIIILSILAVLIVIALSVGLTTAFMKPVEQGGNLTEVALSSCAKIKLTSTSSVNLSNSYPMSRNKGLQTTPYSFTVTSYCDTYVGFSLYIATLSTNTLDASNIHYILTYKGSKETIVEGILSSAMNGVSDFSDSEKTELNTGLKGTYGSIYKIHNESVALKGSKEYDLYLYVDENVTNTTMGKTFSAGVAVKSYDREKIGLEICNSGQNLKECVISYANLGSNVSKIYYHDSTLTNGAGDNSYRYAGPSDEVNNFVCFGTNESPCPTDNLYRIIGVIDDKVKLIKYDYATSTLLGTDGDYSQNAEEAGMPTNHYKGTKEMSDIGVYYWNYKATNKATNTWSTSLLNKTNLNTNFINNIGTEWSNKIATTIWKVGGNTNAKIRNVVPSVAYQNEIVNPVPGQYSTTGETEYEAKIGLMYVSDYGFAASPESWTTIMGDYHKVVNNNWMYMGAWEWTISRRADRSDIAFVVGRGGSVSDDFVDIGIFAVRSSFNLESSVTYVSGSGLRFDPIVIN